MVSEKEIEAAIKAFQMAHTAKVDIPLEQSMRDALEAAARVREGAERDRLEARVAELEKALEPFAREAEDWSPEFDDSESIAGETSIKVGHLRTARAYLDKGRE